MQVDLYNLSCENHNLDYAIRPDTHIDSDQIKKDA